MGFRMHDFEVFLKNNTFFVFDDFHWYTTAHLLTTTASDSGTVATADGVGGIVKINPSDDGTNSQVVNDEAYLHGTTEIFKFATEKPMFFAAKVRPVANTIATINLIAGIKDAVAANTLQDTNAGPAASYSGALFFKDGASTVWKCESSIAGAQTTVTTDKTVGNNAWDVLAILTVPVTNTTTEVHFFHADLQTDGDFELVEVGKTTSGTQFVAQTVTHSSATEMEICLGCKAGTANNSQYLDVDWVYAAQLR